MLLIYNREDEGTHTEGLPDAAERHRALMEDASRRGVFRAADPLAPSSTATTLRRVNGQVLITDGPFAETKEQIAGYYILDCADLDEALEWAARIPATCLGPVAGVEVRPLRELTRE